MSGSSAEAPKRTRHKELLDAAIEYASQGFPVFPCRPGGKEPLTARGFKDATTVRREIENWWRFRCPGANIGLPIPEGILVVDIDSDEALNRLRAEDLEFPTTLTVYSAPPRKASTRAGWA